MPDAPANRKGSEQFPHGASNHNFEQSAEEQTLELSQVRAHILPEATCGRGPEATERKLKLWCSRAWLHPRKSGHQREPRHPDALPSLEELEAFEPPPAHTEAMAERGGRRAFFMTA